MQLLFLLTEKYFNVSEFLPLLVIRFTINEIESHAKQTYEKEEKGNQRDHLVVKDCYQQEVHVNARQNQSSFLHAIPSEQFAHYIQT